MLLKIGNPLVSGLIMLSWDSPNTFETFKPGEFIYRYSTLGRASPLAGSIHNWIDSMYCHCSDLSKVYTDILRTEKKTIQLQYNNIQMQSGEADCGLFTIAFATALASSTGS